MPPQDSQQTTGNQEQTPGPSLKQIRTFQGDVAQALRSQQESLASIQKREHIKHGAPVSPEEIADRKKRAQFVYLFTGTLIFLVLGGVGAWYGYQEYVKRAVSPIAAGPDNRFFSPNASNDLELADLSREPVVRAIANVLETVPDNALHHIVLQKATTTGKAPLITTGEFMSAIDSQAPGSLVRAFDPLFMFGAIGDASTTSKASVFIVIELSSFENAFAGMLAWEGDMARDIGPLLGTASIIQNAGPNFTNSFSDLTDRNKDIRTLYINNEPVILYSFFDSRKLIITDKLETMRTVIERLNLEKLSR